MAQQEMTTPESSPSRPFRWRGYRWAICAGLFLITTINYMDRFMISLMEPNLKSKLHFTQVDYGHIMAVFSATYAIGYALCGWFMDAAGVWIGFALTVIVFSGAEIGMAAATTVMGYMIIQGIMGIAQGANFPGAIKAVGKWFPKKERAFTTGIFNAGTSLGVVAAPVIVSLTAASFGWRSGFVTAGLVGLVWVAWWLWRYRDPEKDPRLSADELAYIRSDTPEKPNRIRWITLLKYKQSWAFIIATMLTSPVWWFWLFWIPDFFNTKHHLDITKMILPMVIIYGMADMGSIGGGWLSSWLISRGWSLKASRKTAMLACALIVVPVFAAAGVGNYLVATFLIGMACAGHQGFSANLFTMASDTMPGKVVGSLVGLGGFVASVLSMFVSDAVGQFLHVTHNSYILLFGIASSAYLVALLMIQIINPRWEAAHQVEDAERNVNLAA